MFGSSGSPTKDTERSSSSASSAAAATATTGSPTDLTAESSDNFDSNNNFGDKRNNSQSNNGRLAVDDSPGSQKRRSSGVAKASAFFASAKNSLHLSHNSASSNNDPPMSAQQSAMQKLGKTDPALSVPQGSLNNSAGESAPGPRSTFRVGVTEDKNKKCRRTMEDTHAYLYNFLSTPAPLLPGENDRSPAKGTPTSDKKDGAAEAGNTSPSRTRRSGDVVETDNGYFAVFDGHAGTFAADWCGKKLHVLLEENIRNNPNSAIPELLDQTFTSVDQQLQKLPLKNSGCTAICAVLRWEDRIPNPQSATGSTAIAPVAAAVAKAAEAPDGAGLAPLLPSSISSLSGNNSTASALPKLQEAASRQRVLYTANVGDARIVLCRNGKALRLSYDHKGSDENEGRRITNAGGLILNNRVNGVLAVTRALGDAYMKDLVTGHPYTTETVIQPEVDEFLILACDGLWDVCNDQDAVDLIRNTADPQLASKQLVDHALARFSTDNLSCMVVRFDSAAVKRVVENKAEPIGVDGDTEARRTGLSEADALVQEARRSLSIPDDIDVNEQVNVVSQDIIREEEEQEPDLEVEPAGVRKLAEAHKKQQQQQQREEQGS